jgi:hypothetical protein
MVTPSFSQSNYTVNPAATALRQDGVYSAELMYNRYLLTQTEVNPDGLAWPTAKKITVAMAKFKNIWS